MNTLEFLRRVLPSEGFYCAIVINPNTSIEQIFFSTLEELATNCQRLDLGRNNTYYALSTFRVRGNRKQVNSQLTKSIFLDIDCGPEKVNQVDGDGKPIEDKGYATQKLGLAALAQFITITGMPKPLIVNSGRGLHVYWVLEQALPAEEWQPLADALKATYKANGFKFDPAVTADRARVLRPIGTHNPKNGAEVKLLLDAPEYALDQLPLHNLLQSVSPLAPLIPRASSPVFGSPLAASMQVQTDFAPSNAAAIASKCQQIQWAVSNPTKVSEPMWYALIGVAAHCHDADNVAQLWSQGHPSYDAAKTIAKVAQWRSHTTGPALCQKFKDERPKGCDGCPMKDKITTPCQLGTQYANDALDPALPEGADPKLEPPKGFKHVAAGVAQTIDGTDIIICPFDIRPIGYGRDAHLGYETVRYKWKRQHVGWQDLVFRQAHLNDESREFAVTIADQGIVLQGKKQIQGFQYMLRSYMDKLRARRSMSNIHASMGWKNDYTQFVIGERLYKRHSDGVVSVENVTLSAATGNVGRSMYNMKGSAEEWAKASSILETAGMPWHIFALNSAFSAPLWAFTGLKGVTISLYGGTGGGKTIIQLMMQSVWGDPEKLHFAAKFTNNALFSRLGVYGNLPMTIDEATHMDDVGEFVYWVTQGRDKARLSRQAVERDAREWATNVTVSTNISFASKMASDGAETDAQMARLLEINIPLHKMFAKSSTAGRTIANFLSLNHGVTGDLLVKAFLKRGEADIRRRIKEATANFSALYGCSFVGTERFWETELIGQHVSCSIAEEEGLIGYDFRLGIQYVVDRLEALRAVIQENHVTGFTLVKEYLNEIAADALTIMHTQGLPSTFDQSRLPRGQIRARFDVYRAGRLDKFNRGTVMIVRKDFKIWLASNGYDWSKLCKELQTAGADATPVTKRCVISRDTALKAGQHYVVGINLNNIEMLGFLDDIQLSADDMTLGQLGVVPN